MEKTIKNAISPTSCLDYPDSTPLLFSHWSIQKCLLTLFVQERIYRNCYFYILFTFILFMQSCIDLFVNEMEVRINHKRQYFTVSDFIMQLNVFTIELILTNECW